MQKNYLQRAYTQHKPKAHNTHHWTQVQCVCIYIYLYIYICMHPVLLKYEHTTQSSKVCTPKRTAQSLHSLEKTGQALRSQYHQTAQWMKQTRERNSLLGERKEMHWTWSFLLLSLLKKSKEFFLLSNGKSRDGGHEKYNDSLTCMHRRAHTHTHLSLIHIWRCRR